MNKLASTLEALNVIDEKEPDKQLDFAGTLEALEQLEKAAESNFLGDMGTFFGENKGLAPILLALLGGGLGGGMGGAGGGMLGGGLGGLLGLLLPGLLKGENIGDIFGNLFSGLGGGAETGAPGEPSGAPIVKKPVTDAPVRHLPTALAPEKKPYEADVPLDTSSDGKGDDLDGDTGSTGLRPPLQN